jgi:hypothetical protein
VDFRNISKLSDQSFFEGVRQVVDKSRGGGKYRKAFDLNYMNLNKQGLVMRVDPYSDNPLEAVYGSQINSSM